MARQQPPAELVPVSDVAVVQLSDSDLTRALVDRLIDAEAQPRVERVS